MAKTIHNPILIVSNSRQLKVKQIYLILCYLVRLQKSGGTLILMKRGIYKNSVKNIGRLGSR